MSDNGKPVLWHIPVSHFNEKARWALAWKGIEHERRAPPPPANMIVSGILTRGASKTFPLLQIDGRAIGDSTEIIAALEERQPDPPLYPDDPAERERALELEDFFDEELGPYIRLLALARAAAGPRHGRPRRGEPARADSQLRPGAGRRRCRREGLRRSPLPRRGSRAGGRSREKVLAAMDRLDAELGDKEYLVGDRFTVADLTAASLFYPLVLPPEGPRVLDRAPAGHRALPRAAHRAPGLPLRRGDVPPPPPAGRGPRLKFRGHRA